MTTNLTKDQRENIHVSLREAIYHLASCWESLGECENILDGIDVNEEDISGLTGTVKTGQPGDAFKLSSMALDELIASLQAKVPQPLKTITSSLEGQMVEIYRDRLAKSQYDFKLEEWNGVCTLDLPCSEDGLAWVLDGINASDQAEIRAAIREVLGQ